MGKEGRKRAVRVFKKVHLVLGLITGLVVFIVSITGALWVFNEEIIALQGSVIGGYESSNKLSQTSLTASRAIAIAQGVYPDKAVHGIKYDRVPNKGVEVIFYDAETDFYASVFVNPVTEEVILAQNHREGFFGFVMQGHTHLWLPKAIGEQLVSWSCFIFLLQVITGIIIWWPKNRKTRQQRTRFIWKPTTKWKRKNHDLHTVVGFYASVLVFIIALTGTILAFNWMAFLVYKGLGGNKEKFFEIPENVSVAINNPKQFDALVPKLFNDYPETQSFELHIPKEENQSYYVELSRDESVFYNNDFLFFDAYNLDQIPIEALFSEYKICDTSDAIARATYDIHIGSIFGITGKIIVFILSLISASLPVTGVFFFLGKRNYLA